jgi:hypothetical protein
LDTVALTPLGERISDADNCHTSPKSQDFFKINKKILRFYQRWNGYGAADAVVKYGCLPHPSNGCIDTRGRECTGSEESKETCIPIPTTTTTNTWQAKKEQNQSRECEGVV